MADYLAPFHMPDFTDEGFRQKKDAYVKEHGYSITLPTFRDIVHIGLHKPMTTQEKALWYSGRRSEIGKSRQLELGYQKERSRDRYNQLLASPIPNVQQNITSILTAWDDAQDAFISLAAIGRIVCKWLPKLLVRWLAWPIGLLWLISTVMGLLVGPTACALNPMACKRYMRMKLAYRQASLKGKARPWSDKVGKLAKYEKVRMQAGLRGFATSGGYLPSFSEGIQMLQTTDQIFGIGVSLGPLMGMGMDLASGAVRWAVGQDVSFKNAPSDIEIYKRSADKYNTYARWKPPKKKMDRSEFLLWKEKKIASGTWGIKSKRDDAVYHAMKLHATGYGIKRRTNWEEEAAFYALAEMSFQGVGSILDYWDPVVNVEGLEHIEVEGYSEPNPLVEEMLAEEGVDYRERIGWPSVNKRWATYEELQTSLQETASDNIRHVSESCPHAGLKAISETSATACGLQAISLMTGEQNISIQFHAAIDIAETLLDKRYAFPDTITEAQMTEFALWTQAHEDNNSRPNLREILGYAKNSLGFEFVTVPGGG